jgi:hypothetical protein
MTGRTEATHGQVDPLPPSPRLEDENGRLGRGGWHAGVRRAAVGCSVHVDFRDMRQDEQGVEARRE